MGENRYAVEMQGICKQFGAVQANKDINFSVLKGEIHAIVGENGAGKTTLMNILFGMLEPTAGKIRINGEPVKITSPNKAIRLGIGMVHQHFELVPTFTVAENVCMGHEPQGHLASVDKKEMVRRTRELAEQSGLRIDPEAKIKDLSVGLLQRVEILKALSRGAEILILDEPTAVLTPLECEELFIVLRRMSGEDKTIIIITHKLKEVMEIADHITILSRGETKGTLLKKDTDAQELARLMMGKSAEFQPLDRLTVPEAEPRLVVEHLSARDGMGLDKLKDVSFRVRPGEILTIAGVEGNGQTELLNTLIGLTPASGGKILAGGVDLTGMSVRERRKYCSYIPEDRMKTGLDLKATVHDNLIAGRHRDRDWKRGGLFDYRKTRAHAQDLVEDYAIRTDGIDIAVSSLSGGNQQKIVAARELCFENGVLVVAQPSRGVDVGATRFIHEQLIRVRNQGCAILLISTDLDEVLLLSDRIQVLFEGRLVADVRPAEITPQELGLYMTGSKTMTPEEVST